MKTFFCILCVFFSCLAHAVSFDAMYEAEGLNMTLLSADMSVKLNDTDYTIQTNAAARGILSLFIHENTIFKTIGTISDNQLRVSDSMMQTRSGKQIKTVHQNFKDKVNYIDYQSVLIELILKSFDKNYILYISDGKRDMRVTLIPEGEIELSEIYPLLQGKAETYSVQIEVVAGKKKGWFFERMRTAKKSPLRLYMQPNDAIGRKMLVLSTFDTGVIGSLYIVLKEIKNVENKKNVFN